METDFGVSCSGNRFTYVQGGLSKVFVPSRIDFQTPLQPASWLIQQSAPSLVGLAARHTHTHDRPLLLGSSILIKRDPRVVVVVVRDDGKNGIKVR